MRSLLLVVVLAMAAACGKEHEQPEAKPAPGAAPAAPAAPQAQAAPAVAKASAANLLAVVWSVDCGSITAAGLYTAPGAAGTCTVRATSAFDSSVSGSAAVTVTLPPNVVAITPPAPTVDGCTSQALTVSVSRGTYSCAVVEGAAGGTVDSSCRYTAPTAAGTYHVVATGSAGGTATATITVVDHVLALAVTPASPTLYTGGTQQFTALVTTTCGTFAAQ